MKRGTEQREMTDEEKVPWFHIFAQVDYSGLFLAFLRVAV